MNRLVLASVVAVTLSAPFMPTADAHDSGVSGVHAGQVSTHFPAQPAGIFCHKQLDNDNGIGVVSQDFEPSKHIYNARGADDFALAKGCTVAQVRVSGGYTNGTGPADSVNVVFFKSQISGAVGRVLVVRKAQPYTDPSGKGNFTVVFKQPVKLAAGSYWVSVQANMSYARGGEWVWNTNNKARGSHSVWANPYDGFETGCYNWGRTTTCWPNGEGPDFTFALLK